MADYKKLLRLLQKELSFQEEMLGVLTKERAAIVKLNQEEIERLGSEKEKILARAIEVEKERKVVFSEIRGGDEQAAPARFSELVADCPEQPVKQQLERTGQELKQLVESVSRMNQENGTLVKQCLGLIATTISIMCSQPETDLPTYGASGKLRNGNDEPGYGGRPTTGVRRSA